ncbi:MAG: aminotransferase class V-fold PLP-dependent enzyme, partial [Acidobacteria bacterium]|nr:aminotransferase class V-fold PLP-dependent enzyme [Acidobacteriota bacterium]
FGACPRRVLEFQAELRAKLEGEPVDFLHRQLGARLAEARAALGGFAGADPDGLAFVPNATTAVNAALRAWDLGRGDRVLTTDHTYGACRKALDFLAARRGAQVDVARVPFPLHGPGDVVEAVLAAVTPRTRLALLDHVTSPTALAFPIRPLVGSLRERGVESIVDGAHALGMLPLDLDGLGAACYTANAHKWLCAPKGAAVLCVRRDLRDRIRPLVISHGWDPGAAGVRFREEWDWTGTDDPTAHLSIPECLRVLGGLLPGGWPALMERNRALALRGREIVGGALGVPPPCPDEMIGSMAALPLPAAAPGSPVARLEWDALSAWTRERGIESWFFPWPCPGGKVVRLSAQAYNHEGQYRSLAMLLLEALGGG